MNRRALFMFLNEIRSLIKCPDVVAWSGIKKSPAREAGAGRATINRTCRLTWGCIADTATECPQSGFFQPRFAIFGQSPISFGL